MKPSSRSEDASAAAMAWQSYMLPVAGSVVVSCLAFFLGSSGYSYLWIFLIVGLNIGKSYLWKRRERRLLSLRATAAHEREVIMAQLQDLPAWVQFPDTERVEWLNKVILQLWPYIGEYAKVFMTDFVIPQVKAQMPAMFKNFKFTKIDMGDIPCRVGGIKVYTHNVGRDRIIVDMDVAYAGDADFTVSCCGFTGGMNNLQFSGKLRAVLKPLLPYPPMVGGVSGSFLEMPKIDFNLTGMGEMVELPGLMNAIRSVVNSQVAALCVLPNEIVVPLAPNVDVTKLFFPEPDGVIRLRIIEAKNLENRDISFIKKGKSDPYCEIQVGSQFLKTRTIDNDLNPVWNEHFEAVVDQADGQKLRIELFDEDQGQDEELGRLSIDLNQIQASGTVDRWCPLEGCKHGDLHIKASWMNLSKDSRSLALRDSAEWLQTDKPIHPALLMVFVDSVSDLPYPKSKLEPSPFVEITLGKDAQRTPVKVKTVNPLFQSKFLFFVRHPEGQDLKFEAFDDGTRRSLGSFNLPLASLIKEPNMEFYQQTFMLTHGVHQSPMALTIRLRGFEEATADPLKLRQLEERKQAAEAGHLANLATSTLSRTEEIVLEDDIVENELRKRRKEAQQDYLGLQPGAAGPKNGEQLNHDILKEYGSGQHIERAQRNGSSKLPLASNGNTNDATAVEASKTVNPYAGLDDPENKLNVEDIQMLRSESHNSLNSTNTSGRSSRLGRMFKSRHEKDMNRARHDMPRGEVEMGIRYADGTRKLVVLLLRARDLLPYDRTGQCNPYTTVKLLDVNLNREFYKKKTSTIKGTLAPIYDNHFEFDVEPSDLINYKLQVQVKDDTNYGTFASKPIIGAIEIRLDSLFERQLPQQWVRLQKERK